MNFQLKHYSQGLFTTVTIIFLASCSGSFTTSTNLDAQNFTDYFAPTKVKVYTSVNEIQGQFKSLGLVEGEDCQTKAHYAKPDEVIARTDARKKAYQLNANAIVFTGCTMLQGESVAKQCVSSMICYGQAYYITANPSQK